MSAGFQWTKTTIIWFCMISLTYSGSIKKEITCYVCTPLVTDNTEASEIYNTFSSYEVEKIPTCGSNAAINFTLQCPVGYKGCLTKIYGKNNVLKSCNEYPIIDCKTANNVKYCFCANNLCNNATILTPISMSTDDEDFDQSAEDGSGLFDDWSHLDKHKYTKNNSTIVVLNTSSSVVHFPNTKGSATKLLLHNNINILSLMFIIYKAL